MSVTRPFRFGFILHAQTPAQIRESARQAEAAGFLTLVVDDHMAPHLSLLAARLAG